MWAQGRKRGADSPGVSGEPHYHPEGGEKTPAPHTRSPPEGKEESPSRPARVPSKLWTHLWFKVDLQPLFALDQLPVAPAQEREGEHCPPLTTLSRRGLSYF